MSPTRRMRTAGLLTVLASLVAFAATPTWGRWRAPMLSGPGDTVAVYGPHRFSTPTGSSTNGIESFTLSPLGDRRYLLKLANGNPDGSSRAASASVVLNGRPIITVADIGSAYSGVRVVQALASDTLQVTVAGDAGAFVDVSILEVSAPTFDVVAPMKFVRYSGKPETETVTFDISASAVADTPHYMCVQNGRTDGTQRASSATVLLNGVEIISQSDLSQQVGGYVRQVTLQQHNVLQVTMASVPSSELTLCFQASDVTPPLLTIATPAPNTITRDATAAVTGTVQDETATAVTVNGTIASRNGNGYSATASLTEGSNTILVHAVDAAGNQTDSTRTIIRDSQAPVLTVTAPVNGVYTNQTQATVTGTVNDATTVTLNVNGTPFTVDANGGFSGPISLVEGSNFLTVTATDQATNATSVVRQVIRDTQAPTVTVAQPAAHFVTAQSQVTVTGTVADVSPTTLTVNGTPATIAANGSYSATVTLSAEGNNLVRLVATDAATNQATVDRTVILDTHAPTLTVSAPADGMFTKQTSVHVTGTAEDQNVVTVEVNGVAAPLDQAGAFDAVVQLGTEGHNQIVVRATDEAGNVASNTRSVIRDTQAPTVTVAQPATRFVTSQAQATITGTVADSTPVTLTVNGTATAVAANGSYTATVTLGAEGNNVVTLIATDAATNATTVQRTLILDTHPPTLSVSAPVEGSYTKQTTVHVTGTALDQTTVAVDVNGVPAPLDQAGAFDVVVPLPTEGSNSILVRATDEAGNTVSSTRSVIRDTQAPVIAVTTPNEGAEVLTSPVTVTGTVTDTSPTTLTVNGAAVTPAADGSFTKTVTLTEGANSITLVATDAATNASTVLRHVTFVSREPGVHPDPSTTAPALDRSIPTLQTQATSFIYAAADPIQVGVSANTINAVRAATIRGRVLNRDLAPIQGVKVSVRNHPEYGYTLSRVDGAYDLVVNGGGPLSVDFAKTAYLPAQRTPNVPWQDFAILDDVILLQLDPVVTTVAINSPTTQMARGSVQTDADGARQATAMFKPGTQATMTLANGTQVPMTTMSVRATEFTSTPSGRLAMPADLPSTSAYTYAVQLTADEAIAAGAVSVTLSKPVSMYIENFLQVPVGSPVPLGVFDPAKGWVPQNNGAVIKVLSVDGGVAQVDVNGDGVAETDATLDAMGIDAGERQKLAQTYAAGTPLWRFVAFTYFPWDANYQGRVTGVDPQGDVTSGCTSKLADPIKCDVQVARQSVGLAGTPYALVYGSDRSAGGTDKTLNITLTGPTILPELNKVQLHVYVGGRTFIYAFAPQANLVFPFTWDGKDAYGRVMQGNQRVTIGIEHVYPIEYQKPPSPVGFSQTCDTQGGSQACTLQAIVAPESPRRYWGRGQTLVTTIGGFDAKGLGLGGFSFSAQSVYDPIGMVVYQGDGTTRAANRLPDVVKTIAGSRGAGFSGDGGPAVKAKFNGFGGISVAADGSIYIDDSGNGRIRKIAPDGTITTVMGNGVIDQTLNGENGSPLNANLWFNMGVTPAPDGGFVTFGYPIIDKIKRVGPDGILHTISGMRTTTNGNGDGGPALDAFLTSVSGLVFSKDGGTIYFSEGPAGRVRKIGPDGIISTVAGGGTVTCPASGTPARQASLGSPGSIALGPDGSLYFTDFACASPTGSRIYKMSPDGILYHIAGGQFNGGGDPSLAINQYMNFMGPIAVAKDGSLFVAFGNTVVWRITPDGKWAQQCACGGDVTLDGNVWRKEPMSGTTSLAFGPDGALYAAMNGSSNLLINQVRRISPPMPGVGLGETAIASDDGSLVYVFDAFGRHLRTVDVATKAIVQTFAYDTNGRLVGITDRSGQTTQIVRDATGRATGTVAPGGQQTALTVGSDGALSQLAGPDGTPILFSYTPDGLVNQVTDLNGRVTTYAYDASGRMTGVTAPDSGQTISSIIPLPNGTRADYTSAGGTTPSLLNEILPGGLRRVTGTTPDGRTVQVTQNPDGTATVREADGTSTAVTTKPDPRQGMQSPLVDFVTTMPSGLTYRKRTAAVVTNDDFGDPLIETDSVIIGGRATVGTFNRLTRTATTVTPANRTRISNYDEAGRLTRDSTAGILARSFGYDAAGRLTTILQGGRSWSMTYDALGRVATRTDPTGRVRRYSFDAADRVVQTVSPAGDTTSLVYENDGAVHAISPSGRPYHTFTHDAVGRLTSYTPPIVGGAPEVTSMAYDLDGRATRVVRPSGDTLQLIYDTQGKLSQLRTIDGVYSYGYDSATVIRTITSPLGSSLTFQNDGRLLTRSTWSGAVAGFVSTVFDTVFRARSITVNGDAVNMSYDFDGLLVGAGSLTLARNANNGLLTGTTLQNVQTTVSYDPYGSAQQLRATVSGSPVFSTTIRRDSLSRIVSRVDTVQGIPTTFEFSYDSAGRLAGVTRDGSPQSLTEYDPNGNRTRLVTTSGEIVGTYDAQDRILTYGTSRYGYTKNGTLAFRTVGTDTTFFRHAATGPLLEVRMPGRQIAYVLDGEGRRIGKKVDGVLKKGWLYDRSLAIVAELNAQNQVVSRFVYASRANVPDYMVKGPDTYRLITDERGSIRLVINASTGIVAQRIDYDAFGRVTSDNNPGFQPFGYAGGQYDEDTKLVKFGERDYDAETGRWIARDRIGFAGAANNLYAYVGGDPLNGTDITGLTTLNEENATMDGAGAMMRIRPPVQLLKLVAQKTGCFALEMLVSDLAFEAALDLTNAVYVGVLGEAEYAAGTEYIGKTSRSLAKRLGRELQRHHREIEDLVKVILPHEEGAQALADLEATIMDKGAVEALEKAGAEIGEVGATRLAIGKKLIGNKISAAKGSVLNICP